MTPVPPQVVYNNLNPSWEPFRVSLHSLCGCDPDRTIKVRARTPGFTPRS